MLLFKRKGGGVPVPLASNSSVRIIMIIYRGRGVYVVPESHTELSFVGDNSILVLHLNSF